MSTRVLLGAHMSINGGVYTAHERGMRIGCTTIQLFTKNNAQWTSKPLSEEDIERYRRLAKKSGIRPVVAHSSYLINLCAKNRLILKKSQEAFRDELWRCEKLGIPYLVFHPGAHVGQGEEEGIKLAAESLNVLHNETPGYRVKSVLEVTAGQGTALGYRFDQLRKIIDLVEIRQRIRVCVDTCHLFAAGYDIRSEHGYERTFRDFDAIIGLKRLVVFHVNDSKRELGSHVDRHEHIGKGRIGNAAFRLLMNDPRFVNVPKILETPKAEDMHEDVMNMRKLRGFIRRRP